MSREVFMRRRFVPAAVAATLVVAGMTGCAASGSAVANCENPLKPGPLSNAVTVDGDTIAVNGPTDILNAQRTVFTAGDQDAPAAQPGDIVFADVDVVDAATGQSVASTQNSPNLVLPKDVLGQVTDALAGDEGASMTVQYLLATGLICAVPGDTLAIGMSAQQSTASNLGTSATVAVVKVRSVAPARATGTTQALPNGFPAVTTDDTGRPGVVLPPQSAPSKVRVAVRILGTGADVTATDTVIGQNLTVSWGASGEATVANNTWESGVTSFGTVEQPSTDYTFRELLNGYPTGSQLVILDPADGSPVVHVVDIVAAG